MAMAAEPEPTSAEQMADANLRTCQARATPAAPAPEGAKCYLCLGGSDDGPLVRGCACRGSDAGFGHLSCLVESAKADESGRRWTSCPTCKQYFTGEVQQGLAKARQQESAGQPLLSAAARAAAADLTVAKLHAGDFAGAEAGGREALAAARVAHGDNVMCKAEGVAIASHLSQALAENGKLEEALELLNEACDGLRAVTGHGAARAAETLATMEQNVGALYARMGKFDLALPIAERALATARRGTNSEILVMSLYSLGQLQSSLGDHEKAVTLAQEAVATSAQIFGASHPLACQCQQGLSEVRKWAGLPELSAQDARHHRASSQPMAKVVGIESRPELNDRIAHIGKFTEATGRFRVYVPSAADSPEATVDLKPSNFILDVGVKIVAEGLTGAPELNGRSGVIVAPGWDGEKGRYTVQLEARAREFGSLLVAIKPANVRLPQ